MTIESVGIKIGHATHKEMHTGCTVFILPERSVASGDPRGPAPGSREAALMQPVKPINDVNAILLTGGSAFGLAAADGVMQYLSDNDIGHVTPIRKVPLVPTAVVYDLFFNGGQFTPTVEMGYNACKNAVENHPAQGNIGAGAGVTVGKWGRFQGVMKSGFGMASTQVGEVKVFAAAVTNAIGDVLGADGTVLAGNRAENGGWSVESNPYRLFGGTSPTNITNTTLCVVATNVKLNKVECHRLAQRAHDGMAMAIRPIHTSHDGDQSFGVSTGKVEAPFDWVGNIGAELVAEAIRNSVRHAETVMGVSGLASNK